MDTILLVYNFHPEETRYYLIPSIEIMRNEWGDYLRMAHGKMVNVDEVNEGMKFLMAATVKPDLKNDPENFEPDVKEEWKSAFAEYEVSVNDITPANDLVILGVYSSGFHY
jgi:hypothetical protein